MRSGRVGMNEGSKGRVGREMEWGEGGVPGGGRGGILWCVWERH